jgi:glycosyltransferase involved in cell wall biosynthesis
VFFGHFLLRKKCIYILHTIPEIKITMPTFKRIIRNIIWRALIPVKCNFVTVSEYCKDKMKDTWKLSGKQEPEVIFNTSGDEVCFQKKTSSPIEILTVGHVVDYKNPLLWIEIACRVIGVYPSIRFTWLGNGPLLDLCKKRVSELGLTKKIHFPGKTTDLNRFYSSCDIYLHLSEIENLSLAILDAMRFGKPCIVSDVGGSPELVVNNNSGYVLKLEAGAENIVTQIVELCQNSNKREKMGYNARNRYHEHFCPHLWENKMLALHTNVMLS